MVYTNLKEESSAMKIVAIAAVVLSVAVVGEVAADEASEIESVKAEITEFWQGMASGEMEADKFDGEQIVAYSSG